MVDLFQTLMLHLDLFKEIVSHIRPQNLAFIFSRLRMFETKLVDQLTTIQSLLLGKFEDLL